MFNNAAERIRTGEVILSYVNGLKEPDEDGKYTVMLLLPQSDKDTYRDFEQTAKAAYEQAVNKAWGGQRPQFDMMSFMHNGNGVKPKTGLPYGAECKGHWVINVSTYRKPPMLDLTDHGRQLLPEDLYSGIYARVTLTLKGYKNQGGIGIRVQLDNILKVRDGERLDGGPAAEDDFADILASVTPSTQAAAPAINPLTGQPM
ncbi:ssDNA-binding protein [uncultured Ruminococcus sp.]|uniref:ssDNA-binding protein n=1 Tax=uncultured Ruminococcus sp. TaxID=165186 RepID=UPI00292D6223|nr:ssDNA-binding protein [uncultured Ruminococcus sp.]